jgi:hypothetical protein
MQLYNIARQVFADELITALHVSEKKLSDDA